jgi:hypothetical protein
MNTDETLMQMVSAAANIRAIEIVNGKPLTSQQMQAYLQNYNGKYSKKTVKAGFGLLGTIRKSQKKTFGSKIFSLFKNQKEQEKLQQMVEGCAQHVLSTPGYSQELRILISNNFIQ